jgi:hypothetical protein
MRKQLLFAWFTFLTLSLFGQTSVYHPFPDKNVVWNFHFGLQCWTGTSDENYSIIISGDTIISGKTYQILTIPFAQSFTSGECDHIMVGYKGAIRHDNVLKKVFIIPPTETLEQLLYDFNMQVGDTVKGYIETNNFPPDTVQSVDSVFIGNSYRKRWNINIGYGVQFIEGIGSTFGLVERSPGNKIDLPDYTLNCFQQNTFTIYPNTSSNCELITAVNPEEKLSDEINIFPNPSNGSFTICFGSENIKEIVLTDILGNILLKQIPINETKIKVDNLNEGIYILSVLKTDNKVTSRKIICGP